MTICDHAIARRNELRGDAHTFIAAQSIAKGNDHGLVMPRARWYDPKVPVGSSFLRG